MSKHKKQGACGNCSQQSLEKTVTISTDALAALNRLSNGFSLTTTALLERLIFSTEKAALDVVAVDVPNGQACYKASELRFGFDQQTAIVDKSTHTQTLSTAVD